MLGVGGGFLVVPMLTLVLHLPIHIAIASSLVSIVATSCIAASVYAKNKLTNIKLGLLLETATTPGAIIGAFAAALFTSSVLIILFGVMLLYLAYTMVSQQLIPTKDNIDIDNAAQAADQLASCYYDQNLGKVFTYKVNHIPLGLGASFFAGILSSLLGIGGGLVKVPVMNLVMRVPMKAAIGTSSFMVAITTTVGAIVYYFRGYIYPNIVAPLIIGVCLGAILGTGLAQRATGAVLRRVFGLLLFATSILMFLKAANIL